MVTSRKRTVEIDVVVDDKQASSQLKAIGTDAQKSAKGFAGLSTGMKATALAAGAVVATKIVDFLGDSVRATIEDEKSKRLLALALENVTGATEQQIEAVETWIDGMSRSRGVADDELRPALANLVRASGDVEKAQDDLGVAMDIAAARGSGSEHGHSGNVEGATRQRRRAWTSRDCYQEHRRRDVDL